MTTTMAAPDLVKDKAPADACRLSGGPVKFAASADGGKTIPIRMHARSAQPIEHWFWGRVVHDMAGMKLHKDVLPCDYCHDEPIGFLNKFDATNEGLFVEGALVPTSSPNDRVKSLVELNAGGVPFESSIYFGEEMKAEFIGEDQVAEVNGYRFEGPGIVIREWWLRGVAVCPYGADMNTSSTFARDKNQTFAIHPLHENAMSAPPTKLAPPLKTAPSKTAPVGSRGWVACLIAEFGLVKANEFVERELTYDQARAEFDAASTSSDDRAPQKQRRGFAAKIGASPTFQSQKLFQKRKATATRNGFASYIKLKMSAAREARKSAGETID